MLEFSDTKIVGLYLVPATESDIEGIIVTAIEGGTGYWAMFDNATEAFKDKPKDEPSATWATKILLEDGIITFVDEEDDNAKYDLTIEKLLKGISLNARHRPFDSNLDNLDIITADCIIQYALFGELVYG